MTFIHDDDDPMIYIQTVLFVRMDDHIVVSQVRGHQPTHTGVAYTLRKTLEVYTEVYIVLLIFVYFHVILPYLVSTLLDSILLPHLYIGR